jgi:hypothetical protein
MFRFTIRDVLWLTVVVALAVAYWLQRKELVAVRADYAAQLKPIHTRAEFLAALQELQQRHAQAASPQP